MLQNQSTFFSESTNYTTRKMKLALAIAAAAAALVSVAFGGFEDLDDTDWPNCWKKSRWNSSLPMNTKYQESCAVLGWMMEVMKECGE